MSPRSIHDSRTSSGGPPTTHSDVSTRTTTRPPFPGGRRGRTRQDARRPRGYRQGARSSLGQGGAARCHLHLLQHRDRAPERGETERSQGPKPGPRHAPDHAATGVAAACRSNRVNFVSFTPGTSFELKSNTGLKRERVLLYWMLRKAWKFGNERPPMNVMQAYAGADHFRKAARRVRPGEDRPRRTEGVRRRIARGRPAIGRARRADPARSIQPAAAHLRPGRQPDVGC